VTARPAELLARFAAGEMEAAPDLCRAYLPVIEGLALAGTLSAEGAREVVAATVEDVISRLAGIGGPADLLALVEESTRQKIGEWVAAGKGKSSEIVAIPIEVAERARGQGLELAAVFGEVSGERSAWMLLEAASWLPIRYQAPFLLRYLFGLSYRHIAELAGIQSDQVASDLEAARRLFERELAFYLQKQAKK
jgi:DNA-directed RNA polymerase specialized sigma24 family protein